MDILSNTAKVVPFPSEFSPQRDSRIQVNKSCNGENEKSPDQPVLNDELLADLKSLKMMALREKYRRESNSHRNAKSRAAGNFSPAFSDFREFLRIVGRMPDSRHWTLDRIDNSNPEYGPNKVRWALPAEQARNRSSTIYLQPFPDQPPEPLPVWAERVGILPDTMRARRRKGWSDLEVVFGRPSPAGKSFAWSALVPPTSPTVDWEQNYQSTHWRRLQESREHWLYCVALGRLEDLRDYLIDLDSWRAYLDDRGEDLLPHDLEANGQHSKWLIVADTCRRIIQNSGGTVANARPRTIKLT